jgi:hypothetical protein
MSFRPFVVLLALASLCCGQTSPLSDAERSKLDPDLVALFESPEPPVDRYDVTMRPDGSREYGLFVRTSDPAELRALGITVGSVFADLATVRVTKEELRRLLALKSVRAVQNSTRSELH